jgi:alpha-mannosidase
VEPTEVEPGRTKASGLSHGDLSAISIGDSTLLENSLWRLEIDRNTGYFIRLYDKRHHVEVFSGSAGIPVVIDDPSDTWGHGVTCFQNEIGRFGQASVRVVESGPVRAVVRIKSSFGTSSLQQEVILYGQLELIYVRVKVDWQEKHKLLKLRFPVNISDGVATYEIPYGHIVRPTNGEEEPAQQWVDLTGLTRNAYGQEKTYGLSLLNDAKYSFDVVGNMLSMTVLRSPIYAHGEVQKLDLDRDYDYLDQGEQTFSYALLPHVSTWQEAQSVRRARELNLPAIFVFESEHPGELPTEASYLRIEADNVMASAMKQAEDGPDLILRCVEFWSRETSTKIEMPPMSRAWSCNFGPCEIKTFRMPVERMKPVVEVDLLERHLERLRTGETNVK